MDKIISAQGETRPAPEQSSVRGKNSSFDALGGTRTHKPYGIRFWTARVFQFRHEGKEQNVFANLSRIQLAVVRDFTTWADFLF